MKVVEKRSSSNRSPERTRTEGRLDQKYGGILSKKKKKYGGRRGMCGLIVFYHAGHVWLLVVGVLLLKEQLMNDSN
jgi:hypothetical protein